MPQEPLTVAEILMTPWEYYFLAGMAFIFGASIGSFLNVAIYRLPLGLSVNKPKRSFCFRCGTQIRWYDNIPIISYLLLAGRCRDCGIKFSPRYALVELLTGLIFVGLWLAHCPPVPTGFTPLIFWYFIFASCLIIGTFTDFDHWIIPPSVPRLGAAIALVAAIVSGFTDLSSLIARGGPFPALRLESGTFERILGVLMGPSYYGWRSPEVLWWEPIVNCLIGAVFAPLMLYAVGVFGKVLFRKEAMGFGDVELFVMIGAGMGAMNSIIVLVLASFFGSIAGLVGMLLNRSSAAKSPLAMGAYQDPPETEPPGPAADPGEPQKPLWRRYYDTASRLPLGGSGHHLPFIPWITLAALCVLMFQPLVVRVLNHIFLPTVF